MKDNPLAPFEKDGRWWNVQFPGHPGLVTDIADLKDALIEAAEEVERLREALRYAESQFRALARSQRARRNITNDERPLVAVADHLRAALEGSK